MDLSQLSDADLEAVAAGRMDAVSEEGLMYLSGEQKAPMTAGDVALKGLDIAGRALDYPGGIARTGLAAAADPFVEADLYKEGELFKAAKGQPLSGEEIINRAGYKGTGESVGGFALEMATDPMTYIGLGPLLGKALGKTAKPVYKSARNLQIADKLVAESGKIPVSDVLYKYGVTGTNEEMSSKASDLIKTLTEKRNEIVDAATATGQKANVSVVDQAIQDLDQKWFSPGAPFEVNPEKAQSFIEGESILKELTQPAKSMAEVRGLQPGEVSPTELKNLLSSLYEKELSDKAYMLGELTPSKEKVLKEGAKAMKEGYLGSIEKALGPESRKGAETINQELSSLLSARKKLRTEANKTATSKGLSTVDTALAGASLPVAGAKKLGDILGTTNFRTKLGTSLKQDSPWNKLLYTPVGQRAIIDSLIQGEE
jgi:hypothetical protein